MGRRHLATYSEEREKKKDLVAQQHPRKPRRGPLQQTALVQDRQEGPGDRQDHHQTGVLFRETF